MHDASIDTTMIAEALHQSGEALVQSSPTTWSFRIQNGKPVRAHAALAGGWLSLVATPAVAYQRELPWRLLVLNARLTGGARFTLDPHAHALAIRADVALHDDAVLVSRVYAACAALAGASSILAGSDGDRMPVTAERDADSAGASVERWRDLVIESAWPHADSGSGGLSVDLGVRGRRHQATFDNRRATVRCALDTDSIAMTGPICREAVGLLLLTVTDVLRLVRAAADANGDDDVVRFEVDIPPAPTAADVGLSLGALALACEHAGQEAAALFDETLAASYLEMQSCELDAGAGDGAEPLPVPALETVPQEG